MKQHSAFNGRIKQPKQFPREQKSVWDVIGIEPVAPSLPTAQGKHSS